MRRQKSRPTPSKALVVATAITEVALPDGIEEAAQGYARKSRAPRTLEEYAKSWRHFARWCEDHGRQALPASIRTVGGYITWLAEGGTGRSLAIATFQVRLASILYYHGLKGHTLDLKHPDLTTIWEGVRRDIAAKRMVRRVKPLEFRELRDILESRRPGVLRDVLDAAILGLGCVVGLRRSELVGLDYQELGDSTDEHRRGFLKMDADGMEVVLMTSKASQDRAETVPIKREHAPTIYTVIEEWVAMGKVKPGMPLFVAAGIREGHGCSDAPQSPYKGVSWDRAVGRWRAQVWRDGRSHRVGSCKDPYEAHLLWAKAKGMAPQAKGVQLGGMRLSARAIPLAVRRRLRVHFEAQTKKRGLEKLTRTKIDELVKEYSGHSLRAGCATSLARAGVSAHKIMDITRHKSVETLNKYIRLVERREDSGLKGVVF